MQALAGLDGRGLVAVMVAYRDVLASHREVINRLNVYPVPDGDTGTNMARTMESVVAEIGEGDGHREIGEVAKALAHGSLMGARGNSGVILSQILRGVAKVAGSVEEIDGDALRAALAEASAGAYQAVQQPVEGTILTVIRMAAGSVADGAAGEDLLTVATTAREAAAAALAATTEQLAALRAAGVVDSGGAGLLLWFDALLHVVDGRPLPEVADPAGVDLAGTGGEAAARPAPRDRTDEDPPPGPRFEVMYLLEASDDTVDGFRRAWGAIGDSIVVVGGDGIHNCHIHTDDIGAAIEAAIDVGRPRQIRVSDLWEEVEEERWVRQAVDPSGVQPVPEGDPGLTPTTAVVAVSAGEGVRRIFESLGVNAVVTGGQSMNPSTAEILDAITAVPADQVVVLPNNNNIVAVARAAAEGSDKTVRVVATRGIPEGFAALFSYDPEGGADENAGAMASAAERVAAGEVTRAVRAAVSPAGEIREGDWLGISRAGIDVVAPDAFGAATGLLEHLVDADHHEVVTIIVGAGAEAADTRRLTDWLEEHRPGVSGEIHQGGQPLYPYLFGVE